MGGPGHCPSSATGSPRDIYLLPITQLPLNLFFADQGECRWEPTFLSLSSQKLRGLLKQDFEKQRGNLFLDVSEFGVMAVLATLCGVSLSDPGFDEHAVWTPATVPGFYQLVGITTYGTRMCREWCMDGSAMDSHCPDLSRLDGTQDRAVFLRRLVEGLASEQRLDPKRLPARLC